VGLISMTPADLKSFRQSINLTQAEFADWINKRTGRSTALRSVQAWEAEPDKSTSRPIPDWLAYLVKRNNKSRQL